MSIAGKMVIAPRNLVTMLSATNNPKLRLGGVTEKSSARKPRVTTRALKKIALPEDVMVIDIARLGSGFSFSVFR